jgi:LysM repeat protein
LNQIQTDTMLKIGQKLKVPAAKAGALKARPSLKVTAPATLRSGKIHEVKAGETLSSISRHYGVSVEALKKANNLGADARLRVNQKLQIPSATSKSAKPSASGASSRARPVVVEERLVGSGREIRGV